MAIPKGVHRVRRKLKSGKFRYHFYVIRGGEKFWVDDERNPTDPDFSTAYAEARMLRRKDAQQVPYHVEQFLMSAAVPKAARSQKDQKKWLLRLAEHFRTAPLAMFAEPKSRRLVNKWREAWSHSPKQFDMAGTHATRFLNWCVTEGVLAEHHCHKLSKLYSSDRSEIVWTDADRGAINAIAPEWVKRLLCAACETGLRPGDLIKLTRNHVEKTREGRRLRVRTSKRNQVAHIPVTREMARVVDETPAGQMLILTNSQGNPMTEHSAAEGLRKWRDKAGLSRDLRLYDCRGTAATRLLNANLSLGEIASVMGWSIRYASQIIEHYARVSSDKSDEILVKLATAKGNET